MCRLDCLASHGDLSVIEWLEATLAHMTPDKVRPEPLLTGKDLIAMGYAPGPQFAEILRAVEDGQLEGRLDTDAEARAFVSSTWVLNHRGD